MIKLSSYSYHSFTFSLFSQAIAPPQGSQLDFGPFLVDLIEEVAGRTSIARTLQLTAADEVNVTCPKVVNR